MDRIASALRSIIATLGVSGGVHPLLTPQFSLIKPCPGLGYNILINSKTFTDWREQVPKLKIFTSLILLLAIFFAGFAAAPALADTPQPGTPAGIDPALWQQASTAPQEETTFLVRLRQAEGGGPETTIDAQFRLESVLALLQEKGAVSAYQSFLGENIIKVTGGMGALRFLVDWPELESVSAYQPGETWELAAAVPQAIDATGQITGKVTNSGGTALVGMKVTAYVQTGPTTWSVAGIVNTVTGGTYAIGSLASGIYRVKFEDPAGNYPTEYFDDKLTFTQATNFNVVDGQTTANINAVLAQAGKISGTLTKLSGGGAASDVVASAWYNTGGSSWVIVSTAVSDSNGNYTIGALAPGAYRVRFSDVYYPPRYVPEWYNDVLTRELAQDITVTAGATHTGINASLGGYGWIAGNVKAFDGSTNLAGITVDVYRYETVSATWEIYGSTTTDSSGNYQVDGIESIDYKVAFSDPINQFAPEFYNDKATLDAADLVTGRLGLSTLNPVNAQLALKPDTVSSSLVTGWNLISLPVTLSNTAPGSAFGSLAGKYGDVYAYDACDADVWKLYNPSNPPQFNDLTAVNPGQGYWINMTSPGTLTLTGTHPLTTQITLCPGWNLIGYPSITKQAVATALASIAGKFTLVYQYKAADTADPWKSYNPAAPPQANDLTEMEAGYGYWIKMSSAATLTIQGR